MRGFFIFMRVEAIDTRAVTPQAITSTRTRWVLLRGAPHVETSDFSTGDPWSMHTRSVIIGMQRRGMFTGNDILEAGIGDGRNIIVAGLHTPEERGRIVGVDLDADRLVL